MEHKITSEDCSPSHDFCYTLYASAWAARARVFAAIGNYRLTNAKYADLVSGFRANSPSAAARRRRATEQGVRGEGRRAGAPADHPSRRRHDDVCTGARVARQEGCVGDRHSSAVLGWTAGVVQVGALQGIWVGVSRRAGTCISLHTQTNTDVTCLHGSGLRIYFSLAISDGTTTHGAHVCVVTYVVVDTHLGHHLHHLRRPYDTVHIFYCISA